MNFPFWLSGALPRPWTGEVIVHEMPGKHDSFEPYTPEQRKRKSEQEKRRRDRRKAERAAR